MTIEKQVSERPDRKPLSLGIAGRTTLVATALASLGMFSTSALADGVPTAPPVAAAQPAWPGFYTSAAVGIVWSETDAEHERIVFDPDYYHGKRDFSSDDVTGTIAIGYDWSLGYNSFVVGVFGDYTFGDIGDHHRAFEYTEPIRLEYDDIWAVGARAGIIGPWTALWYVNGGYTWMDADFSTEFGRKSDDLDGWFIGAGVEKLLGDNFSVFAEYRFSDFSDSHVHYVVNEEFSDRLDVDTEIHTLRVGVAFRFGAREERVEPLK